MTKPLPSQQKKQSRGQGMTEYIIIVSLIAIGTIGIVTLFGDNIRRLYGMATDALAGDASIANRNTPGAGNNTLLVKKQLSNTFENNSY